MPYVLINRNHMKIQSFNDIITNSSSELFIFSENNYKDVADVISELDSIYPSWRSEYEDPKKIKDATKNEIETLIGYSGYYDIFGLIDFSNCELKYYSQKKYHDDEHCSSYFFSFNDFDKNDSALRRFAESWGSTPEELFSNWDKFNPFVDYQRSDFEKKFSAWVRISDRFCEIFKEKFGENTLLFSIDDDPDWEYQEKIEDYATRVHLG